MLDFLRQLAPGHPAALRPALPLRALAGPRADASHARPDADAPEVPQAAPPSQPPVHAAAAPRAMARLHPDTARSHAPGVPASSPGDAVATPVAAAVALPRDAPPATARAAATSHRDDGAAAQHTTPAARQEPRPAAAGPARRTAPRAGTSAPWRPQAPAVPVRTGGPLSAQAVFLHAERDSAATPAGIHISIDRIEVRAPAAPPPAPTAARPRASGDAHSLQDYLQGKPSR